MRVSLQEDQFGGAALNRSPHNNAPDHPGHCEIPQTDHGTFTAQLYISGFVDRQCCKQPVISEHELAAVSVQPWLTDSQVAPGPVQE